MDITLHGTDEQLERYALGQLGESESAVFEEHLLVCTSCQERLDGTEAFILGIREALRMDPPPSEASGRGWSRRLRRPVFVMTAAVAVVALIGLVFSYNRLAFAPAASLQLTALRGEMATAPPTGEIDFTLTDAPREGGPFRLEVVDAAGAQLWTGEGVKAEVHRRFAPGVYFVRLYSASGGLLREYGFVVKK